MSETNCKRCGAPAVLHPNKEAHGLNKFVCEEECYIALQHRNTLELFEDLFAVINLVRLANAREIEAYERGCQSGIDMVEANARGWQEAGYSNESVELMDAIVRWLRENMVRDAAEMRGSSNGDNEG